MSVQLHTSATHSPSVEILVRSYHGDEQTLGANLLPTVDIFVNRREYRFSAILDEESAADHAMGNRLLAANRCDSVLFEPLPADWASLFQGVAFPPPYNRWGYDRQQWSTFYMDRYSDREVLGVVDSDATFYTYLTRPSIFNGAGKVILRVYQPTIASTCYLVRRLAISEDGCAYRNDKLALGEASPYESIMTNRMPIWFWRSTYLNCREHIARTWGMTFDEAYKVFSRGPYSTFNILANYAILHEPDRYEVRRMEFPERDGMSVAQNGCIAPMDIVAGGLRTFQIARGPELPDAINQTHRVLMSDATHLNRLAEVACGVAIAPEHADRHYKSVHEALRQLPESERNAMRSAFLSFAHSGVSKVKMVGPPVVRFQQRVLEELRFRLRRFPRTSAFVIRSIVALSPMLRFALRPFRR